MGSANNTQKMNENTNYGEPETCESQFLNLHMYVLIENVIYHVNSLHLSMFSPFSSRLRLSKQTASSSVRRKTGKQPQRIFPVDFLFFLLRQLSLTQLLAKASHRSSRSIREVAPKKNMIRRGELL